MLQVPKRKKNKSLARLWIEHLHVLVHRLNPTEPFAGPADLSSAESTPLYSFLNGVARGCCRHKVIFTTEMIKAKLSNLSDVY